MLGVSRSQCTVEHIQTQFDANRSTSDDGVSVAMSTPRTEASSRDSTIPDKSALSLPRDCACFRLLILMSSLSGLTESSLAEWIGDARRVEVELETMYQRTSTEHTLLGGDEQLQAVAV